MPDMRLKQCTVGIYRAQNSKFTMRLNFKQIISPILNLSSVDCGSPGSPQNGLVANYTGTTNGSVAFYSCNPGLVPARRMRAVCTEDGWSPNTADLSCAVGTYVVVTVACQRIYSSVCMFWCDSNMLVYHAE